MPISTYIYFNINIYNKNSDLATNSYDVEITPNCIGLSSALSSTIITVTGSFVFKYYKIIEVAQCQLVLFSSNVHDIIFTSYFAFYDPSLVISASPMLVIFI